MRARSPLTMGDGHRPNRIVMAGSRREKYQKGSCSVFQGTLREPVRETRSLASALAGIGSLEYQLGITLQQVVFFWNLFDVQSWIYCGKMFPSVSPRWQLLAT